MDYLKEILFNRESYPKMIERGNLIPRKEREFYSKKDPIQKKILFKSDLLKELLVDLQ